MFILFGWGRYTVKNHGPVETYHCEHCNNDKYWNLYTRRTWFTLFFIPIIPYSSEHLLLCPICNYGVKVDKEKFNDLKAIAECNYELMHNKITDEEHAGRIKKITAGGLKGNLVEEERFKGKTDTQRNYIKEMQEFEKERADKADNFE